MLPRWLLLYLALVGSTLLESGTRYLRCIPAYALNLRGSDIPYNPLFHAYLFVSLDKAVLFVESPKLHDDVKNYLVAINVEYRNYTDLWPFLRRREWGDGKVIY